MSTLPRFMFALLLTSTVVPAAQAATFFFGAPLTGAQESPPAASGGFGLVRVTFDDDADTMRVRSTFGGLTGNTTASHIHIRVPPAPNDGVVTQTPSFPGFPLGVTSGTFDQTYDLTMGSSYNASFLNNPVNMGDPANAQASLLAALLAGNAYFNVHTNIFPGGEIRGNLAAIPEPATWAMMIGGFALAGAAVRRRKETPAIA